MRNNSGSSGGRMKDERDRAVHEVMIEQMFCFGKGEKLSHLKMGENEGRELCLFRIPFCTWSSSLSGV
jgi:hypothetical protein